jgi:hypothetical protein
VKYPNEEQYIAAALVGLCTHSAAKAHYDPAELGSRAAAIGHATAKAVAEQDVAESPPTGLAPVPPPASASPERLAESEAAAPDPKATKKR